VTGEVAMVICPEGRWGMEQQDLQDKDIVSVAENSEVSRIRVSCTAC
jgi:hypothetical protein